MTRLEYTIEAWFHASHVEKMNIFQKLEYYNQQHLKLLLTIYGMGMLGWHDDGLTLMQLVSLAVDGDAADAVQAGDEGITAVSSGRDHRGFYQSKWTGHA